MNQIRFAAFFRLFACLNVCVSDGVWHYTRFEMINRVKRIWSRTPFFPYAYYTYFTVGNKIRKILIIRIRLHHALQNLHSRLLRHWTQLIDQCISATSAYGRSFPQSQRSKTTLCSPPFSSLRPLPSLHFIPFFPSLPFSSLPFLRNRAH